MVVGIEKFKEYFKEFQDSYIIIGGTACDIITEDANIEPRATKDIDIILLVEALKREFVDKFWEFIKDGQYNTQQVDIKKRNCYRFCDRQTSGFPKQIELFSKTPDIIEIHADAHLTPIPLEKGLSSLSAILINDEYYNYTIKHSIYKDDIHLANIEAIICLKAFAFLDNKKRKENGQNIRTRDIVKHKHDIFRMMLLLTPEDTFDLPETIKSDMQRFVYVVKNEMPDPAIFSDKGFGKQNPSEVLMKIIKSFNLNK